MPHEHTPRAATVPLTQDAELEQLLIQVARVFKALGDPVRLRILNVLTAGERTVNEIVFLTGISQPSASRHLRALHQSSLVARDREGASVRYRLASPTVTFVCRRVAASLAPDPLVKSQSAVLMTLFRTGSAEGARLDRERPRGVKAR